MIPSTSATSWNGSPSGYPKPDWPRHDTGAERAQHGPDLAAQTALMLLGNVEIVEGVTLHLLDGQIRKSGFRQELQCLLFAPHRAETFAVSRQRDRHAMHGRNRIQKRPHGMVEILLHIA